jgi:hypothetical protein
VTARFAGQPLIAALNLLLASYGIEAVRSAEVVILRAGEPDAVPLEDPLGDLPTESDEEGGLSVEGEDPIGPPSRFVYRELPLADPRRKLRRCCSTASIAGLRRRAADQLRGRARPQRVVRVRRRQSRAQRDEPAAPGGPRHGAHPPGDARGRVATGALEGFNASIRGSSATSISRPAIRCSDDHLLVPRRRGQPDAADRPVQPVRRPGQGADHLAALSRRSVARKR